MLESLEEQLQALEIQKAKAEAQLKELNARVNQPDPTLSPEEYSELRKQNDMVKEEHATASAKINTLAIRHSRAEESLGIARSAISTLETGAAGNTSGSVDPITATNLLVAAGITRFGVLALGIYLVQILINLYRYNAQVSSFYLACADTLILGDRNLGDFGKRVNALRPEIGFGREPTGVPEKTVDMLGKAMQVAAEKLSRRAPTTDGKEDDKGESGGRKED